MNGFDADLNKCRGGYSPSIPPIVAIMLPNISTPKIIYSTVNTANMIKAARAQFFLFGFAESLNPQTNNITKPTTGIKEMSKVTTQSFNDITGAVS